MANIIDQVINKVVNSGINKVDNLLSLPENPPVSTLNEFRNIITEHGGVYYSNRYVANISIPQLLQDKLLSLSMLGVPNYNNILGLFCHKAELPGAVLNTKDVNVYNNLIQKIPAGYSWANITLSFIETNKMFIKFLFDNWLSLISNPITNVGYYNDDIESSIKINYLNRNNQVNSYDMFVRAMPITARISSLAWDAESQFVETTVEFVYLYKTNVDSNVVSVLNSINNVTSSSLVRTVADVTGITWL